MTIIHVPSLIFVKVNLNWRKMAWVEDVRVASMASTAWQHVGIATPFALTTLCLEDLTDRYQTIVSMSLHDDG